MPTESLYVDGFVNRSPAADWTYVGSTPYLWDTDADHIYTKTTDAESGDYSFTDSSVGSGTINSVHIYFEAKADDINNDNFQVWIYDGSSWSDMGNLSCPQNTYSWISLDIGSKLDSWSKIDLAELYVVYNKVGGADEIYIRRSYLYIDYTGGAIPILVQDALSLSDSMEKERRFAVSDVVGASDGMPLTDRTFSLSDISGLTDAIFKQRNLASIPDSVILADLIYKQRTISLEDFVNLADSIIRDKTTLIVTDILSATDTTALLRNLDVSDSLGLSDLATVNYGATQVEVSDVIGLTDDIYKQRQFSIQDSATLIDFIYKQRNIPITDTINLVDTQFTDKPTILISDTIGFIDGILSDKELFVGDYVALSEFVKKHVVGAGWSGVIAGITNPEKVMNVEKEKIKKIIGVE